MGISIRAYAKHRGISHTSVRKALLANRITPEPDGTIDPVKADAAWSASTDPAREKTPSKQQQPATPTAAPKMMPVPEVAVGAVRETLKEHGEPVPPQGQMTFLQARTANEVMKAQERRIRLQKLKGEVVDRSRAVALVFRLARQERDAWLNWPTRISAVLAAELNVDSQVLHTSLEKVVREHLSELSTINPNFR